MLLKFLCGVLFAAIAGCTGCSSTLLAVRSELGQTQESIVSSAQASTREKSTEKSTKKSTEAIAEPSPLENLHVGLRYRTFPQGVRRVVSWVVGRFEEQPEYNLTRVWADGDEALLLERVVQRDRATGVLYELKAMLKLPPKHSGDRLLSGNWCYYNGQADGEIVAIVRDQPGEAMLTQVRYAWRADRRAGQFKPLPVSSIRCENSGWEF